MSSLQIQGVPRQPSDVIFFLGAGASIHAGVPALQQMTRKFGEYLESKESKRDIGALYKFLIDKIKAQSTKEPNFEEVLGLLYQLTDLTSEAKPTLASFVTLDNKLKDKEHLLEQLRLELEAFIRDQALKPDQKMVADYLSPLLSQNWDKPVEIFSVNYDICVELLCKALRWKIIDGFDPEWNPNLLRSEKNPTENTETVCLYKLHGSALWYRSDEGHLVKNHIRPDPQKSGVQLFDGRKAEQLLLYPAFKQPKETPFFDLAQNLRERLSQKKFVIVIGYAFGDEYLGHLFRDAFHLNPKIRMILIDPNARGIYDKLVKDPAFKNAFENRVTCCPFKAENFLKNFTQDEFGALNATLNEFLAREREEQTTGSRQWQDFLRPGNLNQDIDLNLAQRIYEKAYAAIQFPDNFFLFPHPEFLYLAAKILALAAAWGDKALENDAHTQYKSVVTALWQHLQLIYSDEKKQISCPDIYENVFIDPTKRFLEKLVSWSDNNQKILDINKKFILLAMFLKKLREGIPLVEFTEIMKMHLLKIPDESGQHSIEYSKLESETPEQYWKRIHPLIKKGLPKVFDPMIQIRGSTNGNNADA